MKSLRPDPKEDLHSPEAALTSEEKAGWLSRRLFTWVVPIFLRAYKKRATLGYDDLPGIPKFASPEVHNDRLQEIWAREMACKTRAPSLARALLAFTKPWLQVSVALMWTMMAFNLAVPVLSGLLVRVIEGRIDIEWSYLIVAAIVSTCVLASTMQQAAWHNQYMCAFSTWSALTAMIYEKPIHLTSAHMAHFNQGELVNMVAADCQAIMEVLTYTVVYSMTPFQVVVCVIALMVVLGLPALLGVFVLCVNIYVSDRLGNKVKQLQGLKNKKADARATVLNECMQGVRTVKMNAWEEFVEDRVSDKRREEMAALVESGYFRALQSFLAFGLPTLSTVATIILYEQVNGDMDPAKIFMSVAFFEFLNMSMAILPNAINEYRRMLISVRRIQRLLSTPDSYKPPDVSGLAGQVEVKDASFCYSETSKDGFQLKNINFKAKPGAMVAVVGRVGSGKTTLANSLLSQVTQLGGSLRLGGSTALVSQTAFIMNDTVRENILFGSEYDEDRYNQVIRACSLESDLKQFLGGDMTEVGEKGITISGGQKQRIAIARAVYSQADILVFDDPLSAMDMHVGRHVFETVFQGMLAGKTRIFVTNQLHFCAHCDFVYLLEGGLITEQGTFEELVAKQAVFNELMQHVTGAETEDTSMEDAQLMSMYQEKPTSMTGDASKAVLALGAEAVKLNEAATVAKALEDTDAGAEADSGKEARTSRRKDIMQKELKSQGRVGVRTLLSFFSAAQSRVWGAFTVLVIAAAPVAQIGVNLLLAKWVDATDDNTEKKFLFAYVLTAGAFACIAAARCISMTVLSVRASTNLHARMLGAVLRSPMSFFDTTPVGRILGRFTNDMQLLDIQFPRISEVWAYLFGMALITIIITGVVVPYAAALSVLLLTAFAVLYKYYGAVLLEMQRLQMMAVGPCVASFSAFLSGLDSIRAFDRVPSFVSKFQALQSRFTKCVYHAECIERLAFSISVSVGISIFLGLLCTVLLLFRDSDFVTPGVAGFLLSYASILIIRLPPALFCTANMERMLGSVQRIVEYSQLQPEAHHQKQVHHQKQPGPDNYRCSSKPSQIVKASGWPGEGTIELENVYMRYRPELPYTLKGVSFSVADGEKLGVVGRTGAGKSSVMMSILRMVELETGAVRIAGVDTATLSVYEVRRRLGVIPQESYMFSGTIRSNLDVQGEHSDKDLWEALEMVDLKAAVAEIEGGLMLDSEVKEKGNNFSAGMVQLMCLARVLLKKPRIILMDEATASVDLATDTKVQETIRTGFDGCTVVTVAHRLQTIIDFDRILVMDYGQVAELASPFDLCQNENSFFSTLVNDTGESSAKELKNRSFRAMMRKLHGVSSESDLEGLAQGTCPPSRLSAVTTSNA